MKSQKDYENRTEISVKTAAVIAIIGRFRLWNDPATRIEDGTKAAIAIAEVASRLTISLGQRFRARSPWPIPAARSHAHAQSSLKFVAIISGLRQNRPGLAGLRAIPHSAPVPSIGFGGFRSPDPCDKLLFLDLDVLHAWRKRNPRLCRLSGSALSTPAMPKLPTSLTDSLWLSRVVTSLGTRV